MKKLLIIATVYRVGERIYSAIPKLSEHFDIDVMFINEMSSQMNWYGSVDPRIKFKTIYSSYINKFYDTGFESTNESPAKLLFELPLNYDLILYDDDRTRYGIETVYKRATCPMVGCMHGAGVGYDKARFENSLNRAFDYLCVFGKKDERLYDDRNYILKIGVPSNDILRHGLSWSEHILVITNLLGNHAGYSQCPVQVDKYFIDQLGLLELQQEFKHKVIFKLKSRLNNPKNDIEYMKSIVNPELKYEIILDGDNNELVRSSFIVISAPSTFAFKSIQLGIPTILIKGAGIIGQFHDFRGLVKLDTQTIFDEIEFQHNSNEDKDEKFILDTIEGGIDFTSTEIFVNRLKDLV